MSIKMGPDVGAPLAVAGVSLVSETIWPQYSNWFTYGMTAVGYASGFFGWGGDFLKNIGVSSMPLTAKLIYDQVRTPAAVSKGVAFRRSVARYPAPAQEAPFQGVKLT